MTLKDTPNAISLQALAGGHLPLDLQGSQTTAPSGQEVPPVSHTPQRAGKKAKTTSTTYGPHGSASSASVALQQSLESNLRQQLPTGGLTMFIKGWKQKATPLGRQYCQLAVSARPTAGTDFGLWPTPQARDFRSGESHRWGDPNQSNNLNDAAVALWTTPSGRDWKDSPGMVAERKDGKSRNDQLPRQAFGAPANGSSAPTKSIGSLNHQFPCWLMGFSTAALSSMHLAMQLFRKLRRSL
jgi:hypothetical protein